MASKIRQSLKQVPHTDFNLEPHTEIQADVVYRHYLRSYMVEMS